MPDTLYIAGADDTGEFALARLISQIGVSTYSPCTFAWDDRGSLSSAWAVWIEKWFAPHLAEAFVETYRCAADYRPLDIVGIDKRLDSLLTESLRSRSLKLAASFLGGKSEMRADREWKRFVGQIEAGKCPGHATTLFALQCALYHLPLAPSLSAYVWFELESGLPRVGEGTGFRDRPGSAEEVLAAFRAALPEVAVALRGDRDETPGEGSSLRAI